MLFTGLGSVRIEKNCALGLEYVQDLGHSFSSIRTSQPVNNLSLFFLVWNLEKSRALIGCCAVQVFTIRITHISITILSRFCSQIKLKTSYNWEDLVEVSKMNANFHVQLVTGFWMDFLIVFIACVVRESNDKNYRARCVSAVNQKLVLANFRGENKYDVYRPWSVRTEKNFALGLECTTFEILGKVSLDMDLPVGK